MYILNQYKGSPANFKDFFVYYKYQETRKEVYQRWTANCQGRVLNLPVTYDDVVKDIEKIFEKGKKLDPRTEAEQIKEDVLKKFG